MIKEKILEFSIPVVDSLSNVNDPDVFINTIKSLTNSEGVVVAWANGRRAKAKSDWYVAIHRAKDEILRENHVIRMIIEEKIDDVKPHLIAEDLNRINAFENSFWNGVKNTAAIWKAVDDNRRKNFTVDQRKEFALSSASLEPMLKSAIFKVWNESNPDWVIEVTQSILKKLGSQPIVDKHRWLWGNVIWATTGSTDE